MQGKPCIGKSFYSKKLAEHYNVPHIHTESVLHDVDHWLDSKYSDFKIRKQEKERRRGLMQKIETKLAEPDPEEEKRLKEQQSRRAKRRAANPDEYEDTPEESLSPAKQVA